MKTPLLRFIPRRRSGGFTLIELLVVLTIIAVLATLGLAGGMMATRRAKVLAANNDELSIQRAIEGFYSEYAKLPSVAGDKIDLDSEDGRHLISILLGSETEGGILQNPKRVAFLNIREGKNHSNGIIYGQSGTPAGIFDPWGKAYHATLDTDLDDQIRDPLKAGNVVRRQVSLVYSDGPDKKAGTPDDVKTWP